MCLDFLSDVHVGKPGLWERFRKDFLPAFAPQAAQSSAGAPDGWLDQSVAFSQRGFLRGPAGTFPDVQGFERGL